MSYPLSPYWRGRGEYKYREKVFLGSVSAQTPDPMEE